MAKRLLAVLGAVALVVGAIALRGALDDDDDRVDAGPGDGDVLVVCDVDFADACEALPADVEVRVEPSADTSAAIVGGGGDDVDAWITTDAWLELTSARVDEGAAIGGAEVLAATPVVVGAVPDRVDALVGLCGENLWRCLGDEAERPWGEMGGEPAWGPLRTGMPDADTATGLSVVVAAAVGYFGDSDFAANDFDAAFDGWLDGLTEESGRGDPDPARTLVTQQGRYSAAGSTAARVSGLRPDSIEPLDPTPATDARAVVVTLGGAGLPPGIAAVRVAMVDAGWNGEEGDADPLLRAGVVAALHKEWETVTS